MGGNAEILDYSHMTWSVRLSARFHTGEPVRRPKAWLSQVQVKWSSRAARDKVPAALVRGLLAF